MNYPANEQAVEYIPIPRHYKPMDNEAFELEFQKIIDICRRSQTEDALSALNELFALIDDPNQQTCLLNEKKNFLLRLRRHDESRRLDSAIQYSLMEKAAWAK